MSQQSTNPEISKTPAGELERRQHVVFMDGGTPTVFKVESTLPYRNGNGHRMVALMFSPVCGGEPVSKKWSAGLLVEQATEDQVAAAVDSARCDAAVKQLRDLADRIAELRLSLHSYDGPDVTLRLADGEVSRVAEALGLDLKDHWSGAKRVDWKADDADYWSPLEVTFYGKPAPEPEPEPEPEVEQEWLFTFGPHNDHSDRFVRIAGTFDSARARMVEVFGDHWCKQYTWQEFDAAGLPAVLVELPEAVWPTPGESIAIDPAAGADLAAKVQAEVVPATSGWPAGGTPVDGYHLCTPCGDGINPGEHVYDNGDNTVRCAVCEVKHRNAAAAPAGE